MFLLLVHYYRLLPLVTYFWTGQGEKGRDISIRRCYEAIGSNQAKAILGFHVLTGCDQIGRLPGKTKTSWWKEFITLDEDVLTALSNLGVNETLPDLFTLGNIESFVLNAYGGKKKPKDHSRSTSLASVFEMPIRCAQLPATMSALKYKIFRSHLVCIVLKQSHKPRQNFPLAEGYGWE